MMMMVIMVIMVKVSEGMHWASHHLANLKIISRQIQYDWWIPNTLQKTNMDTQNDGLEKGNSL